MTNSNLFSDEFTWKDNWKDNMNLPIDEQFFDPETFEPIPNERLLSAAKNLPSSVNISPKISNDEIKNAYLHIASLKALVTFAGFNRLFEEGYEKGVAGARVAVDKVHCFDKDCTKIVTEVIFIPKSEVDEYLSKKL